MLVLVVGCAAPQRPDSVKTGAEMLVESGFRDLRGMRVGLIVNPTARVDTTHLIDLVESTPSVDLAALFGPEHGLRGTADAGEAVEDGRDKRTSVPVFSLYGDTRRPTPAMLAGLDALVFDIQDIGARFYTFISTMGLAMESAAEAGIPFFVLDRPNPLGGNSVEGFVREPSQSSFVGLYPVPVMHGMTVGELAMMIKGERMLPGLDSLDLRVVQMSGWHRDMLWPATGLPWIRPSPNIPDFETSLIYPGAAFMEGTAGSEGRGTRFPFRQIGASWASGKALADTLNAQHLPGVRFEPISFTPRALPGMATHPKLKDVPLDGIRYIVTDAAVFRPVDTGVYVLHAFYHQAPDSLRGSFLKKRWLSLMSGTPRLYDMVTSGATPDAIIAAWTDEVFAFETRRRPYLLYE